MNGPPSDEGAASSELVIRNLSKRYPGGPQALDSLDLDIGRGVFGLLGPNGAGKSTLMRTVATLQEPDHGSVRLGEIDALANPRAMRRVLGYLPQDFGLYPAVTAERLLSHLAELKGLVRYRERSTAVRSLLERTNLWSVRHRKLGSFSGGMRQRFGIAQALLAKPRLVIVDEPTSGLDPEERGRFFDALSEVGDEVVVVLSTHIVDDIAQLASRLAVLEGGQLRFVGSPQQAVASIAGKIWTTVVSPADLSEAQTRWQVVRSRRLMGKIQLRIWAANAPAGFEAATPDLEDVYFATLNGLPQDSVAKGGRATDSDSIGGDSTDNASTPAGAA